MCLNACHNSSSHFPFRIQLPDISHELVNWGAKLWWSLKFFLNSSITGVPESKLLYSTPASMVCFSKYIDRFYRLEIQSGMFSIVYTQEYEDKHSSRFLETDESSSNPVNTIFLCFPQTFGRLPTKQSKCWHLLTYSVNSEIIFLQMKHILSSQSNTMNLVNLLL